MADLILRTPLLELRWPTDADLLALAELAEGGVHDPGVQPFNVPWTDQPPQERARGTLQYHWSCWASWDRQDWRLNLAVARDGKVVGSQSISARQFAITREVATGSWLGMAHHGRGTGTQMRAAVLHLAFAGLGAREAISAAALDNAASLGVSRKLGYHDDGFEVHPLRGQPVRFQRLRLRREEWDAARSVPVQITGLVPCLPHFGV